MSEVLIDPKGLIEALLFASDEVVSVARLADVSDLSQTEVRQVLATLASEYEASARGFVLREVAGGWRLFTHPAYAEYVKRLVLSWDSRRLSQAALEVLAVVAYRQPCTRVQVNAIRGVNSEAALSSLLDKGLVVEVGREKGPGQPILYGTSSLFLERFGLRSLDDLPPLQEFAPDDKAREQIAETIAGGLARLVGAEEGAVDAPASAPVVEPGSSDSGGSCEAEPDDVQADIESVD